MKKTLIVTALSFIWLFVAAQSWQYVGAQGEVTTSGSTTAFNEEIFFHNDTLYMSYSYGSPGQPNSIHLEQWDGTNWNDVATYSAPRTIRQGDIEIGPNGTIYAAYSYQAGPTVQAAQVFQYDGANWNKMGDSIANFTGAIDLYVDGSSNVYLANYTSIRKWDGSAFQLISSGQILGIGDGIMHADANGDLYVAFSFAVAADYKVALAKYDGTTWAVVSDTVDVTSAINIHLDTDGAGNLYLGLKDAGSITFPVMKKLVGGVWQDVGNASTLPTGNVFSFDVDTAGNPLIASTSYAGTVYMYNGSGYGKLDSIEVSSALIQVHQVEVDPATNDIYVMLTELVGTSAVRSVMKYEGGGTVGITDNKVVTELTVYPNPASNTLTIKFTDTAGDNQVKILDMSGSCVLEKNQYQNGEILDISSLPQGMYLIHVTNDLHSYTNKLMKQ